MYCMYTNFYFWILLKQRRHTYPQYCDDNNKVIMSTNYYDPGVTFSHTLCTS